MKKLIALALLAVSTVVLACPRGTHPVCEYDPVKGKSVCVCVPS